MKKFFYSALAIALLASCGKEEGGLANEGSDQIVLGSVAPASATPASINTKAPINSNPGFAVGNEIGIYGIPRTDPAAGATTPSAAWVIPGSLVMDNVKGTISAAISGGVQAMTLTGSYVYAPYAAGNYNYVDFHAYYPYASTGVTPPAAATAPVIAYTITGQEDIMASTAVSGYKGIVTPPALAFQHKLTQIYFYAVAEASFPTTERIQSITVTANTKCQLDLGTKLTSNWNTPGNITVPSATTSAALPVVVNGATWAQRDAVAVAVGNPVMLQSGLPNFSIVVVTNRATYPAALVTPIGDANFLIGKAYKAILTFKADQITLTASAADWITGGQAEGDIQ